MKGAESQFSPFFPSYSSKFIVFLKEKRIGILIFKDRQILDKIEFYWFYDLITPGEARLRQKLRDPCSAGCVFYRCKINFISIFEHNSKTIGPNFKQ